MSEYAPLVAAPLTLMVICCPVGPGDNEPIGGSGIPGTAGGRPAFAALHA